MVVAVVIGFALLAVTLVGFALSRTKSEAILDHQRALAALRDAERPRSPTPTETRPLDIRTDHVHILDEPPPGRPGPRKRPRPSTRTRANTRRRNAAEIAERPTIASLPTMGAAATIRLSEPADPPHPAGPIEPVATAIALGGASGDAEPATPVFVETDSPRLPAWQPAAVNYGRERASVPRVAIVVGVLAVALVVAVVIGVDHHGASHVTVQPPRTRPARSPRASTTTKPPPTTTTVAAVVASATGDGTVTVAVPYTVTLAATGTCWVSVTDATGQTLFEGTLSAGQQHQVTGSGPLVIRLGNTSAMTLMLNGGQLDLSRVGRTADVQFVTT